jgi:hypothetical protein
MVDQSTPINRDQRSEPLSLADLGKKIKSENEALANALRSIVPRAISIGEDLNNAKRIVGHGGFLKWVRLNCAMTNKTAERYMKLATNKDKLHAKLQELSNKAEDKFEMLSNLSLAQAERLITERNTGGGGSDNVSDRYDNAEKALMKRLSELSTDVAEAAASETIKQLQFAVEMMKKHSRAAA